MTGTWTPRTGEEFGAYRLGPCIGQGGMSVVYRAEHLRLGRTVALKLLAPELTDDDSFRQRFLRESHVAAALDHPNIIPVYESDEYDGVYFIAMRYVSGSDLKTVLRRDGPLPPARVVPIVVQTASALAAAHARGLVHRDVKPGNILVADREAPDDPEHVYLSDFGVAKRSLDMALTKTGVFVGTAEYSSPEQIEGRPIDGRTDVYALGCVLYECLTGAPAFDRDSEVALMYAHLLEPPPAATSVRSDLPPEIDGVIAKAMAKAPDDRFGTAKELAAAMREALGYETAAGSFPVVPAAATGPAAATSLRAATSEREQAGAGASTPPSDRRPRTGPSRVRSRLGLALLGAAVVVLAAAAAGAYLALRGGDSAAMPSDGGSMSMGTGTIIGELIDPHLPSAVMETCERTKPLTDDFLRTVRCSAPRGITVTYSRAHGGEALRGYFDHELASHVGDRFPTATTCRARGGSATTWVRDGDFGHIEGPGGDTAASAVKGRVLCYARAGKAWLEWTDTPTKLYAVASAPAAARGRLYAWWADGAGPGEATGHGAGMEQLGAYPDEVERELLLAHMPAPDRCRRGEIPDREVFLRTIVCKQGDTDLEATYSVAHGTDELRSYLQRRILRTGIADPGRPSGECRKYTPAYQFWKRPDGNRKRITSLRSGSTGGIVCYHDAQTGRPTLEWTDNPRQIFAQASRGLGDEALLYSWWQRQSGPEQERSMEADSGADHMG